ncbi:MAG: ATP-binding protein [Flavobacteriia bacterium]|nr:ATP-binding protein [Flavobacteriia bacterium]
MKITREIKKSVDQLIDKYPIIAITGPRQSGKTTFLKSTFPEYEYINLENPDNREFATEDPNGFLKRFSGKTIIDEVQRVPSLFSYLQSKVDEENIMGHYILSGSQNFHLMQNITQSLAGRVAIFRLFPFDFQELKSENLLNSNYLSSLIKGFYPAIFSREINSTIFYSNYIETYIQRDVTELLEVKNLGLFKKFLSLLATRAGQLLNLNSLANECGISQPTAKSWLTVLESSYVVFTLQPYFENFSKRLVKTPKIYFYDSGLLSHLLGLNDADYLMTNPIKGALFENMIIAEHIKRMYHKNEVVESWFWRDSAGNEIDLLYSKNQELIVHEIKSTETIMTNQMKGLNYFEKTAINKKVSKKLIYTGNENYIRQNCEIIPWFKVGE